MLHNQKPMGYAVYHIEKGKGDAKNTGHHIDRTEGKEHTYRHADSEKKDENIHIKNLHNGAEKKDLQTAIDDRIKEGYTGKKAIRKDAVKYLKHVATGSHEDMKKIAGDPQKFKEWAKANIEFIKKEFGKENIVRCSVHLDERTPHMHFVTVPLTKDGRLSAKEMMGGREQMSERQDRYAAEMEKFGLKRGIKGTGIKHEDARAYYGRIEKDKVLFNRKVEMPGLQIEKPNFKLEKPGVGELMSDKKFKEWEKRQKEAIRASVNQNLKKTTKEVEKSVNEQLKPIKTQNSQLSEENGKLKRTNEKLRTLLKKERNKGIIKKKDKGFGGMGLNLTRD